MKLSKHLLWLTVAGTAFLATAASNPQCARTEDFSVNPSLRTLTDGNPCTQSCVAAFQESMKIEQSRFKEAMAACGEDEHCREQQAIAHAAIVDELVLDKGACFVECEHEQGAGTGGQ